MTDLEKLDEFIGKYVNINEPNGDGLAGWLERVEDVTTSQESLGRWAIVDYGMGFFVTPSTKVEEVEPPCLVKEAVDDDDRGFLLYGSQPIRAEMLASAEEMALGGREQDGVPDEG